MADNDVKIKLSLDGADSVKSGLAGVGDGATDADSKLSKLGGGLAGVGTAFAGLATVAVGAGAALGGAVIGAYADYEQNIGGIETLFGAAGQSVQEYADSVGKSVQDASAEYDNLMAAQNMMISNADQAYMTAGVSANAYMENVTSFSAALISGLEGDTLAAAQIADMAMVDMSDNANKMGTNIVDIQNAYQGFAKQNYTMLDNLKLGYGGTQAEMARLINDSGVLGDTMEVTAETVNDVSFDKVIEAIHTVQDEMGITGTTMKEATETISGSIGMLSASWENLMTGLGDSDADVAQLATNVINSLESVVNNVAPVISTLGSNLATLGPQIGDMLSGLVGTISGVLPDVLSAGVSIVEGLVSGVTSALPDLITALVPGLVGLVEMVAQQAPLLLDAGIQAVVALANGLAEALPTLIPILVTGILDLVDVVLDNLPIFVDAGLNLILALAEGLTEALPLIIERMPELIEGMIEALVGSQQAFIDAYVQLFSLIGEALPQITEALSAVMPELVEMMVAVMIEQMPIMIEGFVTLFSAIVQATPQILAAILGIFPAIGAGIKNSLLALVPQMVQDGYTLFTASVQRIPEVVSQVSSSAKLLASTGMDMLKSKVGEMSTAGFEFFMGSVQRVAEVISTASDRAKNLAAQSVSSITGSTGNMVSAGFEFFMGMLANIGQVASNVVTAITDIGNSAVSAISGLAGSMASAGLALVQGLWSGISSGAGWLKGMIQGWASDIVSSAKAAFGIHSPSRVFRDEVGKQIILGFVKGIDDNAHLTLASMDKMGNSIVNQASSIGNKASANFRTSISDINIAIGELEDAFNGSDSGYGQLSYFFGDNLGKSLADGAYEIGRSFRGSVDQLNMWSTSLTQSLSNSAYDMRIAWSEIEDAFNDVDSGYGQLGVYFGNDLAEILANWAYTAGVTIRGVSAKLNQDTSNLVKGIISTIDGNTGGMATSGINLVQGLLDGINSSVNLTNRELSRWTTSITNKVKQDFGIHSPSTVFRDEVGKQVVAGFALGIDNNAWMVTDSFDRMFSDALAQAEGFTKQMNDTTSGINAGTSAMDAATSLLTGKGGLEGMMGSASSLLSGVATIAGLVGAGPLAAMAGAGAALFGVGAALPKLLEAGKGLVTTILGLPIISDIAGFFGYQQPTTPSDTPTTTTPEKTPVYATMPGVTTSNYVNNNGGNFTGPLIQVESMSVRNDSDIRKLSIELRSEMNRELRSRGVLQ